MLRGRYGLGGMLSAWALLTGILVLAVVGAWTIYGWLAG